MLTLFQATFKKLGFEVADHKRESIRLRNDKRTIIARSMQFVLLKTTTTT